MLNWIFFGIGGFLAYIGISAFGHFTGGKNPQNALESALSIFSPKAFALLIIGNILFSVALYYGFKVSQSALPIIIAIGVLTSFIYSITFLNLSPSWVNYLGVLVILTGIYLLSYT